MLKTIELFAGVGGFRLGLEKNNTKQKENFKVIWSNQYEPSTVSQQASDIYKTWFGDDNHSSTDIEKVAFEEIPKHDLLVGGFPCQDYSVAKPSSTANGIEGKKGGLWWTIYKILKYHSPKYVMLENVDSLLKSPSSMRGRDFAIILASLAKLDYAVEWRVINAAEYGMPQRRKRVFICAYKNITKAYKKISKLNTRGDLLKWITDDGVIQQAFPKLFDINKNSSFCNVKGELYEISENSLGFNKINKPFEDSGVMFNGSVASCKGLADYKGEFTFLEDILIDENIVPDEFFIPDNEVKKWAYVKGAKKLIKTSRTGHKYPYAEGSMTFPDALNRASRTIITGEGGASPSRFKHVIRTKKGRLRRLTPFELEKLNMFPGNLTKMEGIKDSKRAFFMGNALVVGVVTKISESLLKFHD